LHGAFIWDDESWTSDILRLLRDFPGLCLIWSDPTALQQYYPLSGTTFWLDYHFWKFWTFPYHVENVVLHLIAVLLFWKLLQKLEVPGAWLAAGIFALHPVMVESVAWVTERKNVLSMVFFLGALLAYGQFNSFWKAGDDLGRKWNAYALAFIFFLAALLSKTATFSFPAVILLICWWKDGRIQWRRDALPSLPFFAIAIGFSGVTAWLEKNHVGATGSDFAMTFPQRCLIAGRAFWFYTGELFWPENLCFIYPRWNPDAGSFWQWLVPIAALAALAALWLARKKIGRGPAAAVFFFAGTLFPVLGFMNAYGARYSFVWDHWVYLSSLGVIALFAGLTARLAGHFKKPAALFGCAAVLLPLLAFLTWKQTAMYSDNETLWRTTIAKDPDAFLAYNNLGYIFLEKNQMTDAIPLLNKSLELKPDFVEPQNNLGDALMRIGQINEGMSHFQKAAELDPASPASYYNLGNAWLETGHPEKAITQFKKALEIYPGFAKAQNNLGSSFLRLGQTNEAFSCFQKAVVDDSYLAEAHDNLGNMLLMRGQITDAVKQYRDAFENRPDFQEAFNNLTALFIAQGKPGEAIKCYEQAISFNETADLHNDLGNLLVSQHQLDEAIRHYDRAVQLKPESGEFHYNLAVILALRGRLDEAVAQFGRAIELMPDSGRAHYRLALALQSQKNFGAAIAEYEKTLQLDPRHAPAENNLAWLLATCPDASLRDGGKAIKLAQQARQIAGVDQPQLLDTLAAAYAEAGRFGEAVETATRALNLPAAQNNKPLADAIQTRLKLYEANLPYQETDSSAKRM
jgi:tetratricopeptide (TPR) repeat protein